MPGSTQKSERYKWVVLSNTTLGVLMATIDMSIMLIALPDIFRGIGIDPLAPGNSFSGQRAAHRVRLRHRRLPGRGGHVLAAGRQVPLP